MKRYVAEFIGTLLVVVVTAGAVVADSFYSRAHLVDASGSLTIAFAYGLTIVVVLATFGRVSGGYANPAVTLGLRLTGRLGNLEAAGLFLSQVLGSAAGGLVVWLMAPREAFSFAAGGAPGLAARVSVPQGIAVEMVATFLVTLAIWGTAVDDRVPRYLAPVAAGLAVTAGVLLAGPFTGGGLNPARWFGPALASNHFANWQVWIAGPFLGGLLGCLVYENFLVEKVSAAAGSAAGKAEDAAVDRALPAGSPPAEVIRPSAGAAAPADEEQQPGRPSAR